MVELRGGAEVGGLRLEVGILPGSGRADRVGRRAAGTVGRAGAGIHTLFERLSLMLGRVIRVCDTLILLPNKRRSWEMLGC